MVRSQLPLICLILLALVLIGCGSSPNQNQTTQAATRTVTVNWTDTYWTSNGPDKVPISSSASLQVEALVPQADGSITVFPGSTVSDGVITIPNVPTGYYWLSIGSASPLVNPVASGFWTNASIVDAGHDIAGSPAGPVLSSVETTTFNFDLSGLDSSPAFTTVNFQPAAPSFSFTALLNPASSSLNATIPVNSNTDWSQVNTAFFTQYVPSQAGLLEAQVLGPALMVSNLSFSNGQTNTLTETLQSSPQSSLTLNVLGSQWASLFTNVSPVGATAVSSDFALSVEPFIVDANASCPSLSGPLITLASGVAPSYAGGFSTDILFDNCWDDITGSFVSPSVEPPILTDGPVGTLTYGDPFPTTWTRELSFYQRAIVNLSVPNSSTSVPFNLADGESVAPSSSPLAPLVSPVQSPTINGASLFSSATLNTVTPNLTWTAPGTGNPYGYSVRIYVLTILSTGVPVYETAGVFYTNKTSLTPLPLSAGNTYVFTISALVDGAANIETSPFRSALPRGYSNVVSAPITISSSAGAAIIHGDASIVKSFSEPRVATEKPPISHFK